MTSRVEIANLALQKLGAKRITSLTQDHTNAIEMNTCFDLVRDAELRRYPWSFAIRRASIAADADGPVWGDHLRYTLPNDYLALIRDDEGGQAVDWKIEAGAEGTGTFILSADASPLEIRYVARVEDPNAYDTLFIESLACKLAMQCCKKITGSNAAAADAKDEYKDAIAEAKRIAAIEKEAQAAPEDDWINARR